jgi:preprotein translocase subunit SecF
MVMNYRYLLVIPVLLLVFSAAYLVYGYQQRGEWFLKGIELKGGTVIALKGVSLSEAERSLEGMNARVRKIGGFSGERVLVEIPAGADALEVINLLGVSPDDASIRTIGPSLGEAFWRQAQIGIAMAFALMGIVVFFLFRKVVPSFAVIFAAVSDIVVTLAFMQVLSIPLSLAGLAAILMLIGYSVDTDILLTSRMLRGSGLLNERLKGALKTGLTISFTTMGVLGVLVLMGISSVISQIAAVLLIGLALDLANTWLANSVILKWYIEKRGYV